MCGMALLSLQPRMWWRTKDPLINPARAGL